MTFLPFFFFYFYLFFAFFIFYTCFFIAGRTCLMFVVFQRRMMSTLQWSRPETNVSFQPACCCAVTLLMRSVARKCCSSQVSFMSLTCCLQSCVTERTTEPNTAQTERVLTSPVDPMTPHLWTAVCISQAKECLHNIHVLCLFHPVLSLTVLHAQLFVVLGFTLRASPPFLLPVWSQGLEAGQK